MQIMDNHQHSILFNHIKDQQQYKQIYSILKQSLSKYPQDIIREISEQTVGTIKLCNKPFCKEEINILYQTRKQYMSSKPPHSQAMVLGFKYCPVLNVYWCFNHIDQITQDPWCPNKGLFDSQFRQLQRCNDCNGSYVCHDKCSRLKMGKCGQCNKKRGPCYKCRFTKGRDAWGDCIGCGKQFCKDCLIKINIGKEEEEVCRSCFNENETKCEKCNATVMLGYKGKHVGEKYIDNKWSICIDGKCMKWVCLDCSTTGLCSTCDE